MTPELDNLFFDSLVRGYAEGNQRFIRREGLAGRLDEKPREAGQRFMLLTALLNRISTLDFPQRAGSSFMFVKWLKPACSACRAQEYN
jgi:hypothetical protein